MCLRSIMSKEEQTKFLKKVTDPMICWKTVDIDARGLLHPMYNLRGHSYHAGVNVIPQSIQYGQTGSRRLGAHFYRYRADAIGRAGIDSSYRRVIRCMIAKRDIDAIGHTSGYSNDKDGLTIVAHKATFAKTVRKVG